MLSDNDERKVLEDRRRQCVLKAFRGRRRRDNKARAARRWLQGSDESRSWCAGCFVMYSSVAPYLVAISEEDRICSGVTQHRFSCLTLAMHPSLYGAAWRPFNACFDESTTELKRWHATVESRWFLFARSSDLLWRYIQRLCEL